jgi:hypothetical protein
MENGWHINRHSIIVHILDTFLFIVHYSLNDQLIRWRNISTKNYCPNEGRREIIAWKKKLTGFKGNSCLFPATFGTSRHGNVLAYLLQKNTPARDLDLRFFHQENSPASQTQTLNLFWMFEYNAELSFYFKLGNIFEGFWLSWHKVSLSVDFDRKWDSTSTESPLNEKNLNISVIFSKALFFGLYMFCVWSM